MDRVFGGATNHDRLPDGFDGVAREFRASLTALLERNGLVPQNVCGVAAGLSGADTAAQTRQLEKLLRDIGFAHVQVCNDGFLPVMAECSDASGIAYNCGTGVCCTAMDPQGKMTKIGGLDEWSGDAGGGVWLQQMLFSGIYDDVVLSGRKTVLSQEYAQELGVELSMLGAELDETLPAFREDAALQRRMITSVFQAYDAGDETARAICSRMIERAADYIGAAYSRSDFGDAPLQIVLSGSILLKAATARYLDDMKAAVEQKIGRRAQWLTPENTPVFGAAAWLKKQSKK